MVAAVAVRLALDAGITLDEDVHRQYGDAILAWFRTGFADTTAVTFGNLYFYGGLFDLVAQWVVSTAIIPLGPFETRHVLTALIAVLGIVGTWKLADCLAGPRAGFVAAAFLLLTPTWVGHGLFNPKDIPFGAAAVFALYGAAGIALRPAPLSWSDAIRAGAFVGLALAVRPGGMFLMGYPVATALGRLGLDSIARYRSKQQELNAKDVFSTFLRIIAACAVAWVLMLTAWPWAQQHPFSRPLEAAAEAAHFEWRNLVLFKGERIWSYDLPADYLLTWFRITLPETYLVAAILTLPCLHNVLTRRRIKSGATLCVLLLVFSVAAPLLAVVIKRPIIYDAHRHFLFLFPSLAAIAGVVVSEVLSGQSFPAWLRAAGLAGLLCSAGLTVQDMRQLHPYEYIYFNRMFGGLKAADGRFETDYWGAANREGFKWVMEHYRPGAKTYIRVAMCYSKWQLAYYKSRGGDKARRFKLAKNDDVAQIFIATTRDKCNESRGKAIYKVERQGVALLYVFAR